MKMGIEASSVTIKHFTTYSLRILGFWTTWNSPFCRFWGPEIGKCSVRWLRMGSAHWSHMFRSTSRACIQNDTSQTRLRLPVSHTPDQIFEPQNRRLKVYVAQKRWSPDCDPEMYGQGIEMKSAADDLWSWIDISAAVSVSERAIPLLANWLINSADQALDNNQAINTLLQLPDVVIKTLNTWDSAGQNLTARVLPIVLELIRWKSFQIKSRFIMHSSVGTTLNVSQFLWAAKSFDWQTLCRSETSIDLF